MNFHALWGPVRTDGAHQPRPGSRPLAFEIDDELVEAIRGRSRLAEIPDLQIETCDGRIGLSRGASGSCDLVVLDAWAGVVMPPALTTAEFLADVARSLPATRSPEAIAFIADRVTRQGVPRLTFVHGEQLEIFRGQASSFRD